MAVVRFLHCHFLILALRHKIGILSLTCQGEKMELTSYELLLAYKSPFPSKWKIYPVTQTRKLGIIFIHFTHFPYSIGSTLQISICFISPHQATVTCFLLLPIASWYPSTPFLLLDNLFTTWQPEGSKHVPAIILLPKPFSGFLCHWE